MWCGQSGLLLQCTVLYSIYRPTWSTPEHCAIYLHYSLHRHYSEQRPIYNRLRWSSVGNKPGWFWRPNLVCVQRYQWPWSDIELAFRYNKFVWSDLMAFIFAWLDKIHDFLVHMVDFKKGVHSVFLLFIIPIFLQVYSPTGRCLYSYIPKFRRTVL